jgi:hypothetical protein
MSLEQSVLGRGTRDLQIQSPLRATETDSCAVASIRLAKVHFSDPLFGLLTLFPVGAV